MPAAGAARATPLVEVLQSLGFKVRVLTSSGVPSHPCVARSYFPVPNSKASFLLRALQEILLGLDLGLRILWFRKKTAFCFISSPPFLMAGLCATFARFSNTPYSFDVRDRYPQVLEDLGVLPSSNFAFKALKIWEFMVYEKSILVSTVTNGLLENMKDQFPWAKFSLLKNGYDEQIFPQGIIEVKKADAFTLVFHGKLGRFYDPFTYCEIFESVEALDPTIEFLFIGDLPQEIRLNKSKNLRVVDALPLQKLAPVLASCHLGLCIHKDLPSTHRSFPAKVYDFIGAGLPVLAGPGAELIEIVRKFNFGIGYSKIKASEIAHDIVRLKNAPNLVREMRDSIYDSRVEFGRREVARNFFTKTMFS